MLTGVAKGPSVLQGAPAKPVTVPAAAPRPAALPIDDFHRQVRSTRTDGAIASTDGALIAFRRTVPPSGEPNSVFVILGGTLSRPSYADGLAERLARDGIATYATSPRIESPSFEQYAKDLDAVVKRAAAENPGARITVGGVSAGANFTLLWKALFGGKTSTIAMSPVVVPKFLTTLDALKLGAGFVSERASQSLVNTPMSRGVPLTTNPVSPEMHLIHPERMKVPAGFFDHVTEAIGDAGLKGGSMRGPLHIAMAGNDQVTSNLATKAFSAAFRTPQKTLETFPGLAHDLSQEFHDPAFVETLSHWIRF